MTYTPIIKREAPQPPYTCEMVDIDVEGVPFLLGALYTRSQAYWWITADDAKYGRWLMNKEGANLLMPCSRSITNLLEAQYNLLDAALRGEIRDVTGTGVDSDPYIYSPAIPQTVDPIVYETPGLQYSAFQSLQGIRNLADGTVSTEFSDVRNFRQQLEDLIAAIGSISEEDQTALLEAILAALGGGI